MSKWPLVCLVASACANNVPQDRSTGPDGRLNGATPIVLANGEGKVAGVVTYPGGDRVDWKMIDLPEGKQGRLDLQITYSTPRPGLKVTFDVFDQWHIPVKEAVVGGKGRIKSATVPKAEGKYFVRVYAPRRGDAGQYKLTAAFHEELANKVWNPLDLAVADPPKLPEVPGPCEVFDRTDPACADQCPAGAPANWKGCVGPTTQPPTPPPTPTPTPTPPPPPPVVAAKPVGARVLKVDVNGDGLDVTVSGGSELGVAKGWKVQVLRGETANPLAGGTGTIVRVNKTTTLIHVKLTTNQIGANPNVQLSP